MPEDEQEKLFDTRRGSYGENFQTWEDRQRAIEASQNLAHEEIQPESGDEDRIARLLARLAFTSREAPGMNERNQFVKKHNWIAYHRAEATTASAGLEQRLRIAGHSAQNRTQAMASLLKQIDRYRIEASVAIEDLEQAFIDPEEPKQVTLPAPDPAILHRTEASVDALTEFMLSKESLDQDFKWHPRGKGGQITEATLNRLAEMKTLIDKMTDEQLVSLWQVAYTSNKARAKYWAGQISELENSDSDNMLAAQSRI